VALLREQAIPGLLLVLAVAAGAAEPLPGESDARRAVAAAVKAAAALESHYWEQPQRYPRREDVYALYRRGYGERLARRLADFTLSGDRSAATWVPREVHVAEIGADSALVWYRTPEDFTAEGSWRLGPFMVVRLSREGDRWVVVSAEDRPAPPGG
jgi:hypothetical protein